MMETYIVMGYTLIRETTEEKKIENNEAVDTNPDNIEFLTKEEGLYRGFLSHYKHYYPIKKGNY